MYYTLKQSAEFLGLGIASTKRLIQDNQIPAIITPSKKNPLRATYKIDDAALRQFKRSKATAANTQMNGNVSLSPAALTVSVPVSPETSNLRRVADVKRELGIKSDSFIYDRIKAGRITATREHGAMMLSPDAIETVRHDWQHRLQVGTRYARYGLKHDKPMLALTSGNMPNDPPVHAPYTQSIFDSTSRSAGAKMLSERLAEREQQFQQTQARLQSLERNVADLEQTVGKLVEALGGL